MPLEKLETSISYLGSSRKECLTSTYLVAITHISSLYNVIAQDEEVHCLCSGSESAKSVNPIYLELTCLWIRNGSIMINRKQEIRFQKFR